MRRKTATWWAWVHWKRYAVGKPIHLDKFSTMTFWAQNCAGHGVHIVAYDNWALVDRLKGSGVIQAFKQVGYGEPFEIAVTEALAWMTRGSWAPLETDEKPPVPG